jgi:hypothetical protein
MGCPGCELAWTYVRVVVVWAGYDLLWTLAVLDMACSVQGQDWLWPGIEMSKIFKFLKISKYSKHQNFKFLKI